MLSADPRVLIELLHSLRDGVGRVVRCAADVAGESKWLQSQIGEQVQVAVREVGNAASLAAEALSLANECDRSVQTVSVSYSNAAIRVQHVAEFAASVRHRAAVAIELWRGRVAHAEGVTQSARESLADARDSLAMCLQPVYVRGPNGQVIATYRDCTAHRNAVTTAERALSSALAQLSDCKGRLARAIEAGQRADESLCRTGEAVRLIETSTVPLQLARSNSDDAVKVATAAVNASHQAHGQVGAADREAQQAATHEQRCRQAAGEADRISRTATEDLSRRIDRLEKYNRPARIT